MSIEVGPFVGVGAHEARISFEAVPHTDYLVTIKSAGGHSLEQALRTESDGSALARFTDLPANTRFNYLIQSSDGAKLDLVSQPSFSTFPLPGQDADLCFAFFSCHRPFREKTSWAWEQERSRSASRALKKRAPKTPAPRRRKSKDSRGIEIPGLTQVNERVSAAALKMWTELEDLLKNPLAEQDIRFLLGLGDQVYADELWQSKKNTGGVHYSELSPAALLYEYNQVYHKFLHIPEVQRVASLCPMFMTWDDHEIRDGWGSRGDEKGAAEQRMFLAATQAYAKYQLAHNPHVDAAKGYYAFQYGKVGFVTLDLRRYRSLKSRTILGDEQKNWFENWLRRNGPQCRVVFIACSVPVIHVKQTLAMMASKSAMKMAGVSDDLADQWSHQYFLKEMQAFAELLFELSNHNGVRFILLGGDVHVGTFAVLRSKRRQDEFHPVIYQCTSSPISNTPSVTVGRFLNLLAQEVGLGPDLPFSGRLLKVFTRRNFAVIEVRQNPKNGEYGVVFEMHCEGKPPERFPTLW